MWAAADNSKHRGLQAGPLWRLGLKCSDEGQASLETDSQRESQLHVTHDDLILNALCFSSLSCATGIIGLFHRASTFLFFKFKILCVYDEYTCHSAHVEIKDNFMVSVLSFHLYVGSRD